MLQEQLLELARIKEPEARSRLIRTLVGEYARANGNEPSAIERELFSKIVLSVFEQLDRPARYELVVRLAKTDRIVSELADRLSAENFELSEPVIECSPVISQKALLEIARKGGNDKRLSAARRKDLSEETTDTLIARSSRDVVHMLLDNTEAPFSVKGVLALLIFANTEIEVLSGIAKRALEDEEFLETLLDILENKCPLMPPPLEKALKNGSLSKLVKMNDGLSRDHEIDLDGMVYSRHEASVQISTGELSFDTILRTLFKEERVDAAIWMIARQVNLSDEVISETIKSDADGAILRLMLQTGIDDKTYRDFLKARSEWLDRSSRGIPDLVMRYKTELRKAAQQPDQFARMQAH